LSIVNFATEFGPFVRADGVWSQIMCPVDRGQRPRPALFLDRDGVINEDVGYLHHTEGVRLVSGAAEAIAGANRLGFPVVVVTNQGGVGLGYFGWAEFAAVQDRLLELLAAKGAHVDGVFASPYHPRATGPYAHPSHPSRKPNPGMLLAAADWLAIDLGRSWIVGDHARDIEAAKKAGLAGGMHVLSGHGGEDGQRESALAFADDGFRVVTGTSIVGALRVLPLYRA
jgi:D-glycero-D-manno-heptose 1,7-bisphosphate phosphatase